MLTKHLVEVFCILCFDDTQLISLLYCISFGSKLNFALKNHILKNEGNINREVFNNFNAKIKMMQRPMMKHIGGGYDFQMKDSKLNILMRTL